MNLNAEIPVRSPSLKEKPVCAEKADATFQAWQLAEERMLLYLKSLRVPPEEQLGLALAAIRHAKTQWREPTEPVAASLEALWHMLQRRHLHPVENKIDGSASDRRVSVQPGWQAVFSSPQTVTKSVLPAMRRQCMISAPMELVPWRRTVLKLIQDVRGPTEGVLYRKGILLGALFALLAFLVLR